MHKWIYQIEEVRQAIFVGFFGPIGVSAVFYLFVSLEFIEEHLSNENGVPRSDVEELGETIRVVVWFLVVCSVVSCPIHASLLPRRRLMLHKVVHGLSIPLGKVGYLAPRTFSRVLSETLSDEQRAVEARRRIPVLGKYLVRNPGDVESRRVQRTTIISGPTNPRHPHTEASTSGDPLQAVTALGPTSQIEVEARITTLAPVLRERDIRFLDESQASCDG